MLAVILNQHYIKEGGSRRNEEPHIPPHPTTKQKKLLFLRRMGILCENRWK